MRVQILNIMEVNDHSLRVLGVKLETIRCAPRNHRQQIGNGSSDCTRLLHICKEVPKLLVHIDPQAWLSLLQVVYVAG